MRTSNMPDTTAPPPEPWWQTALAFLRTAWIFITQWWKVILTVLAVAALSYQLGSCDGRRAGRAQMQAALDKANLRALEQKNLADAATTAQRAADEARARQTEELYRNALKNIPDSTPSPARVALGCARLRAAGITEANLPPACRAASGAPSGPAT